MKKKHPRYNIICTSDGKAFTMGGKELKGNISNNNNGYIRVFIPRKLQLEGVTRDREFLHRLICEAFHGLPEGNENQVHHIDENKTNNSYNNLMWVNQSYNCSHRKTKGYNERGPVYSYDVLKDELICYTTQAKACETIGKHSKSLYTALKKGSKCAGLHWFYAKDYEKGIERLRNG